MRFLLGLCVLSALILGLAVPAAAHGLFTGSTPAPNASLSAAPSQVILRFSEPVNPALSSATLFDREGRAVSSGSVVAGNRREVILRLPPLTRGVYTVKWRALWPADGHTTSGFFLFAVGEAAPQGPQGSEGGSPSLLRLTVRWIGFLSALALVGAAFFHTMVLRPGLSQMGGAGGAELAGRATAILRRLTLVTGAGVILAAMAEFFLQTVALLDAPLAQIATGGMLWPLLGGTKTGWSFLIRTTMAILMLLPSSPRGRILQAGFLFWFLLFGMVTAATGGPAALLGTGVHGLPIFLSAHVYALAVIAAAIIVPSVPQVRVPELHWAASFAGPVLLVGYTMGAHAAGSGLLAALMDWIHLLAASFWIGGLISLLALLLRVGRAERSVLAPLLVPRFSTRAGICLGILVVTGIFSAWLNIAGLPAFLGTVYGRTLFVKILLVLPLAALGAFNHFVVRPRLTKDAGRSHFVAWLTRTVTGEVTLGVVILAVVALLTITPPAKVAAPAAAQRPLVLAGVAEDVKVRVTITPAQPGWNRIEVSMADESGTPIAGDSRAIVRLRKLDEPLDPTAVTLNPEAAGRFVGEGGELGLPGWWEAELIVRRRGRLDVSTSFPLRLGTMPPPPPSPEALRLLEAATQTMDRLTAWRQIEQITDGVGGGVSSRYEWVRPDRLRLVSSGNEVVIIGGTRFQRIGSGQWEQATLQQPLVVAGALRAFAAAPQPTALGRRDRCAEEECQVLLWEAPGGSATFAAWIGLDSRRAYKLVMIAPSHYMTLRFADFDTPIRIVAPQ